MVNKVILIGRLTNTPELKQVGSTYNAKFTLAVERPKSKNPAAQTQSADFINIVTWSGLADVAAKWVKKGQLVYIEGKLHIRSYDDKNGQRQWITEVSADNMRMLGYNSSSDKKQTDVIQTKELDNRLKSSLCLESDLPF